MRSDEITQHMVDGGLKLDMMGVDVLPRMVWKKTIVPPKGKELEADVKKRARVTIDKPNKRAKTENFETKKVKRAEEEPSVETPVSTPKTAEEEPSVEAPVPTSKTTAEPPSKEAQEQSDGEPEIEEDQMEEDIEGKVLYIMN